jgi:ubiquinone/menaquinone biosynthesis C-methylase UbiE
MIFATEPMLQHPKQYNGIANKYSDLFVKENELSIAAYFKQFDFDLNNKKLIDLGCGDGHDLQIFGKHGAILHGIDASEDMVKQAKVLNPSADIKVGYFENIPYPDNSFDIVVSKWSFQTSAEIEPIYKEVLRVLKPNGYFVFLTGHPTRQFIEKKKHPKDYFKKEMVESVLFGGKITVKEPSHTMNEYLSPFFLHHFVLQEYMEGFDAGAEKVEGDIYPIFVIFKARKL